MQETIFRFAPSPNGLLHLGHAYSALLNYEMATQFGGKFLLRIEDIDTARCKPEFELAMKEDLKWLGIDWEDPIRRQSEHFPDYEQAFLKLKELGLVYPSVLSRSEIKRFIQQQSTKKTWPLDPDGVPIYPNEKLVIDQDERKKRLSDRNSIIWRLDMKKALASVGQKLDWYEEGFGPDGESGKIEANPAIWGDVILVRKDTPTSYHLSVVVDDAIQKVSHIVRGQDLFWSTSIQRLLQYLLNLPTPQYFHHELIFDESGEKLSKSEQHTGLRAIRAQGASVNDVKELIHQCVKTNRILTR